MSGPLPSQPPGSSEPPDGLQVLASSFRIGSSLDPEVGALRGRCESARRQVLWAEDGPVDLANVELDRARPSSSELGEP